MNDSGRARANLDAGPLTAYAFNVSSSIGHRAMRYTFARAAAGHRFLTAVRIDAPQNLSRTEVAIWEDLTRPGGCCIRTFIPTMRAPRDIGRPQMFDCLPLTDISYLDLMRTISPSLLPKACAGAASEESAWATSLGASSQVVYRMADVAVTEFLVDDQSTPVARLVHRNDVFERSWQVVEFGSEADHGMPVRLRVGRAGVRKPTIFERVTPVIALARHPGVEDVVSLLDEAHRQLSGTGSV
ncbi:hypothetical protein OG800_48535 [Streptomyces sp. NBC_00445]|uniref:hypothetical protein n=1 Tax=Streptomyces sp. NBC_00445 TaxID=2975745 RepID=UPI002E1A529F